MLAVLNEKFFGTLLPIVISGAGIYFLIRLRFFLFAHPIKTFKTLLGEKRGRGEAFRAACVALSGTLGVGNIAGVASAIAVGGAGAIFWMWIFGLFAMAVKYVEVVTAMLYKSKEAGGAAYYIEKGLRSKGLGRIVAVIILASSFFVGNMTQSSAAGEAMLSSFGLSKWITGTVIALVTYFCIKGGIERVTRFSSVVIPLLSLGYLILSSAIIVEYRALLPEVLNAILSDAFSPEALLGGGGGFALGRAIRYGASRGLLSNEAGCGTSGYAHASSRNTPVTQGLWGVFEVFVDTELLCTLTALTVLLVSPQTLSGDNGMMIAIDSYGVAVYGGEFVALSSALFALASIVCWSYYGEENLKYLEAKKNSRRLYLFGYCFTAVVGAVMKQTVVWELSDIGIAVLAVINTLCLVRLSPHAIKITREYFDGFRKRR